jgi:hypothetical protein
MLTEIEREARASMEEKEGEIWRENLERVWKRYIYIYIYIYIEREREDGGGTLDVVIKSFHLRLDPPRCALCVLTLEQGRHTCKNWQLNFCFLKTNASSVKGAKEKESCQCHPGDMVSSSD